MNILKLMMALSVLIISSHVNAGFFDEVNKALGAVNQVLNTVNTTTGNHDASGNVMTGNVMTMSSSAIASPTESQLASIANNLTIHTGDIKLDNAILGAKHNISQVLLVASCQVQGYDLAAGDALSPNHGVNHSIIPFMVGEPKDQCLTVNNVGGWRLDGENTLKFSAVFSSNATGKPETRHFTMKNEYGKWLLVSISRIKS